MSSTGAAYIISLIFLIIAAIWTGGDDPWKFLDAHGAYMVFCGTAIIALISVPWEFIKRFFPMIRAVSGSYKDDNDVVVQEIVAVAEAIRGDPRRAADQVSRVSDPFLRDGLQLLAEGFEAEDLEHILRRRVEVQKERENSDANMFKKLGKYPPATGLIGTVMGMMALLGTLGQEGSESKVGPAMSVALAATLYGVILANIIILPVGDNLLFRTSKSIAKREMIIEGLVMIRERRAPIMIREVLMSHLSPTKRDAARKRLAGAA